jgi:hypothetical protein
MVVEEGGRPEPKNGSQAIIERGKEQTNAMSISHGQVLKKNRRNEKLMLG